MIWEQLLSFLISLNTKADRLGEWKEQKPLLENLFYRFFKLGLKLIELRDCVKNYPSNVDATIKSLIENLEDLDSDLHMLKPSDPYLHPDPFETPSSIPKHHWWWF
jgi:hypothetical protein